MENSLAQLADGKQVKFLFLPEGEDPDTFVRSAGREGLEQLIASAQPLSAFLLNELASRVDRTTPEGRARLLQEAKPLVRQIAAPMLALMLRKSLADLAGLSGQELDREFQIKPTPSASSAPARPAPPAARSMLRRLIELLLLDPGAAREVDRAALADAAGLPAFDGRELAALSAVLEALAREASVTSPGELFRGTAHAALVQELESGLLERQAAGIGPAEARAEFLDGWNNLLEQMRRERLREMTERLHKHELTTDDKARYLALLKASASLRS
jgi:DNA primase